MEREGREGKGRLVHPEQVLPIIPYYISSEISTKEEDVPNDGNDGGPNVFGIFSSPTVGGLDALT